MKYIIVCLAVLFSGPGRAQDSIFPIIDVEVSAEARVERHPTIREGMVEVVVRGCYQDLGAVLTGRTNPYVGGMDATYSGSGVWIVKAMMSRPDSDLRVVVEDGRLVIDVVESLGTGEEDEAEAAFLDVEAAEIFEPQLVAVEVERFVEIADAHHCVQVFHGMSLMYAAFAA